MVINNNNTNNNNNSNNNNFDLKVHKSPHNF